MATSPALCTINQLFWLILVATEGKEVTEITSSVIKPMAPVSIEICPVCDSLPLSAKILA